jgi:methionyl-tRNA synthetase
MNKYYLTTPIYYVNAAPHIGHAYTTIVADLIKRFKRMQGYQAVLTTGSDEHGVNVERAAQRQGKTPQEFCDVISVISTRVRTPGSIASSTICTSTTPNRATPARIAAGSPKPSRRRTSSSSFPRLQKDSWSFTSRPISSSRRRGATKPWRS